MNMLASGREADTATVHEGEVLLSLKTPDDPELVLATYAELLPRAKVLADDAKSRLQAHLLDAIEERRRIRSSTNPRLPDPDDLPLPREPSTSVDPARFLTTGEKKQRREFANFWVFNGTKTFEGKRSRTRALNERKPNLPWPPPPVKMSAINKNKTVLDFSAFNRERETERKRNEMMLAMAAERGQGEKTEQKKVATAKRLTEMGGGKKTRVSRQSSKTMP
jgi:hypothetical protein